MQHIGHLRKIDPVTGEADPEQGWITNNKFLYSDDGFQTTKSVFGKYTYDGVTYYGILAEAIVGSIIVGTNLEIGNATGTLKFNEEGFSVTNGTETFKVDPSSGSLVSLSNGLQDVLYVGEDGKLYLVGDGKDLDITLNDTVSSINQTNEEIKLSVQQETLRATTAEGGLATSLESAQSNITQNANNIALEVSRATTAENDLQSQINTANTKIDQTAESITISAQNVQKYVDENYSTTTEMNAAIKTSADSINSTVSAKFSDYSTTTEMNSAISQSATSITSTVTSNISSTYATKTEVQQLSNKITSTVTEDDVVSIIEQSAEAVKIAWNNNSKYIELTSAALQINESYTNWGNTYYRTLMTLDQYGMRFYYQGNYTGKVGTNSWANTPTYKGLHFNIDHDGGYICWSATENEGDTNTTARFVYHHGNDESIAKRGFYFYEPIYTQGYLYLHDEYYIHRYTGGWVGYAGPVQFAKPGVVTLEIDPQEKTIDCYTDIDMHSYSITNTSDVRLKTNIQDTQVSALEALGKIKMKEFDWIESGEHEEIGMIAQQLQAFLPHLVHENVETGALSIKTTQFIPYLIKAIQELTEYITGESSTFSLRDRWMDTYTDDEKLEFMKLVKSNRDSKTSEECVPQPPVFLQ